MRIFFATRVRGFFQHLFSNKDIHADFIYRNNNTYEVNSWLHTILGRCVRSRLGDLLGIIQTIKCKHTGCEIHGSYNRFLDSDRPYFIYVENPTALYHYCLRRNKTVLGKRAVVKNLSNSNLKALIFMSKACADTFEKVCEDIPKHCFQKQIYPLIPKNIHASVEQIKSKRQREVVKLLYIAQGVRFLSKGALEIIESYKMLKNNGVNCCLSMITNISQIDSGTLANIEQTEGITLLDFKFSYEEMEQIYAEHDILLQPTSDESFGLTILEALHAGLAIIASRLYAIPEIVIDGKNGYLIDPAYWFFDKNKIPNPKVWNNRKKTIYSGNCTEAVVKDLYDRIKRLVINRELLEQMSLTSYQMAQSKPFSSEYITCQWNELITSISAN